MRSIIVILCSCLALGATAGDLATSVDLSYRNLTPLSDENVDGRASALNFHGEYGQSFYGAIDAGLARQNDFSLSQAALHLGYKFDQGYMGIIGGMSGGDLSANFAGLEGGINYRNFSLDLRASSWQIDGIKNSYRLEAKTEYAFNDKWSVFYDYSHFKLDDNDINFDDYFAGVRYQVAPNLRASFGMGEYHPIVKSTQESNVWRQYGFNLEYRFGKTSDIHPLSIPNFSLF